MKTILSCLFLCFSLFMLLPNYTMGADLEVVTKYKYGKHPLVPSQAIAYVRGNESQKLGQAELIEAVTEQSGDVKRVSHFLVEETHFDLDGNLIYKALSTYHVSGDKISERKILGQKHYNLFRRWSTGAGRSF